MLTFLRSEVMTVNGQMGDVFHHWLIGWIDESSVGMGFLNT